MDGSLDTAFVGRLRKFSLDMTTDLRYRRFDVSRYLIIVGWCHPPDDCGKMNADKKHHDVDEEIDPSMTIDTFRIVSRR